MEEGVPPQVLVGDPHSRIRMYLEDVPSLSAEEVTMLLHGYTALLPQLRGGAIKQPDKVRNSLAGDQKQLHLLFAKLVRIPAGSTRLVHRARQRRLVPDGRISLTSYTLVVGSRAVDSTTNGYLIPFISGGLPQLEHVATPHGAQRVVGLPIGLHCSPSW